MNFDVGQVSHSDQRLIAPENEDVLSDSPADIVNRIREFFRVFKMKNKFIYRDELLKRYRRNENVIEIDLDHFSTFNTTIVQALQVL